MAITDVPGYAHLSDTDLEEFGAALEAIRRDIESSRGANDRAYIKRVIAFQRALEVAARLVIGTSKGKFGWAAGTAALPRPSASRTWNSAITSATVNGIGMNDPEIHSTTCEWDMAGLTSQWKNSHNYKHHVFRERRRRGRRPRFSESCE